MQTIRSTFLYGAFFLTCFAIPARSQDRLSLDSGSGFVRWEVRPDSAGSPGGPALSKGAADTAGWIPAQVPGTVFTDYVHAGLEENPDYGDNIYRVDKRKYNRNFWYRAVFPRPGRVSGKKVWLHFDGINRKADLFLNGVCLGSLDGFMDVGQFDVTALLSDTNVLAVRVYCPRQPIPNYASPTYISSDGWDWMPPVPGLETGITDDVSLLFSGPVRLEDPWIRTTVPSPDTGILRMSVRVANASGREQEVQLKGVIEPGQVTFTGSIRVPAGETRTLFLDTARFQQLRVLHPRLWWPNGYGEPHLYTCRLTCLVDGKVSDSATVRFGIREYRYDTTGHVFHIWVNGKRIFVKGGNWGMSDYLLRCRGAEYDLKVKLHREMHLNMIRNWIGSTTDEEFYDACDKYGIMVWDDFWLNSHPNLPRDVFAFNRNAVEKIKRLRNHPSVAVWCGDNEGTPLPPLNGWLREDVRTFDGGDRWYQPNSHAGALTGSGPWTDFDPQWYFTKYPGGFGGRPGWGFRTEIGTAVFPTFESFKQFMPPQDWWPENEMWNKHFFGKSAANAGPDRYVRSLNQRYGKATGIEDFCRKAQLLNLETNKALYEGWLQHMWDDASGIMTWMSQSAYPSMVWQTYDYYYDLTGAYWGVRKACEPLHIQWSCADNVVKVVNTTAREYPHLRATAAVYEMNGKMAGPPETAMLTSFSDSAQACFTLDFASSNLADHAPATASSVSSDAGGAAAVTDGSLGSRWSSAYSDDQWIYVDLGSPRKVSAVTLHWEAAYARAFKLQVSGNAKDWKDVYETTDGRGGDEHVSFHPVTARFVRMQGVRRATAFGYSLYAFEVFAKPAEAENKVQFIRLRLQDAADSLLSENFYWRSTRKNDYTPLNRLPPVRLSTTSQLIGQGDRKVIRAVITNPRSSHAVAFAVHVQAWNAHTGKRLLPALMNDNYFTLFPGESKTIRISMDAGLLGRDAYRLTAEPYHEGPSAGIGPAGKAL